MAGAPTHGGAYLSYYEDTHITYQVDETAEYVDLLFFGTVELELSLSKQAVRRCRDLLDEALAVQG